VSRVRVLAACLCVWSLMTALGGVTQNFGQFIATRVGVAVGESGCSAPSYALISDLFSPSRRGTAIAVFILGSPIGIMISLGCGGWMNDHLGWRLAMIGLGVPGILLGLLMALTVRDQPRAMPAASSLGRASAQTAIALLKISTFRRTIVANTLIVIGISAMQAFAAPFLMRIDGWTATRAGASLGLLIGLTGVTGTLLSGILADLCARKAMSWIFLPTIAGTLIAIPFYFAAWLAPTGVWTLIWLVVPLFTSTMFIAPSMAAVLAIAPLQFRAVAAATYTTIIGLVGMGVGPTLTGFLSDFLAPSTGINALRYALCLLVVPQVLAVPYFFSAARALASDQKRRGIH
jgi:predicted MFS family arabinose efflux permease